MVVLPSPQTGVLANRTLDGLLFFQPLMMLASLVAPLPNSVAPTLMVPPWVNP